MRKEKERWKKMNRVIDVDELKVNKTCFTCRYKELPKSSNPCYRCAHLVRIMSHWKGLDE